MKQQLPIEKTQIPYTFDDISKTYDRVNRLISFGTDRNWRKKLVSHIPQNTPVKLLDLATGTADVVIEALNARKNIISVTATDLSEKMMQIARQKLNIANLADKVTLKKADLLDLPFQDNTFDCITIAFGLRNAPDTKKCINEIARVLKQGGNALILEFSLPKNFLIKAAYLLYFKYILPVLGGIISGNIKAYRYLTSTVVGFPQPEIISEMMKDAGLKVKTISLSMGIVTIYIAAKAH